MFRTVHAKIGPMRKAQEFSVCPVSNAHPNEFTIQSDKRIARVNVETRMVTLSDGKGGHQGFHKLLEFAGAKEYDAPAGLVEELLNGGPAPKSILIYG